MAAELTPDDQANAAEVALRLLDGPELAAAEARVAGDRAFAAAVSAWAERFAVLFALWPEEAPPADGWNRLARTLKAQRGAEKVIGRWRIAAIAATAMAAGLAVTLAVRPPLPAPVSPTATPVASGGALIAAPLAPAEPGMPMLVALVDADGSVRLSGAVPVPAGRSAELWIIPADGTPRPLGVLPPAANRMALQREVRALVTAGATLAISRERLGGSTTGKPATVIATGKLAPV